MSLLFSEELLNVIFKSFHWTDRLSHNLFLPLCLPTLFDSVFFYSCLPCFAVMPCLIISKTTLLLLQCLIKMFVHRESNIQMKSISNFTVFVTHLPCGSYFSHSVITNINQAMKHPEMVLISWKTWVIIGNNCK